MMTTSLTALGDSDIRAPLRARLLADHASESDTVVIEELGLCRGQVRIDVAVVNGSIHGYEIKSDRDSLRRLDGQVDFYSRVLDRATMVVGERYLGAVQDIVPPWWGVMRVEPRTEGPRFKIVRRGRKNPARDPRSLVELLWLEDALALLEARGLARGLRGKPRRIVWDKVCEDFSLKEISAAVRERLKARAAPPSLRPLR